MKYPIWALLALSMAGNGLEAYSENTAPPPQLPPPYATPSAGNPPRVIGWPSSLKPNAPAGFRVDKFAENLKAPRWMHVLPNGDVLVAESFTGRIILLRDTTGNGIADHRTTLLHNLNRPFGMAYYDGKLYVASTDSVDAYDYSLGDETVKASRQKLFDLPAFGYNHHWTRNLLLDPSERKLYMTVGSGTNVDEERSDAKDWRRAAILQSNLDGSKLRLFASGLRNPVGLAFAPKTHKLWTAVNERDGLGDDLVPDFLTSVTEGGFYGWPYSYFGHNQDPRHKGERPDLVAKALVPDFPLGSHVAALGLDFYTNKSFPTDFQGGAFVGEHGSWNRSKRVGYKVIYVPFKDGKPSGPAQDFLTGFAKGENEIEVYGRPVGVVVAKDGALLVADDGAGIIWRVSYPAKK